MFIECVHLVPNILARLHAFPHSLGADPGILEGEGAQPGILEGGGAAAHVSAESAKSVYIQYTVSIQRLESVSIQKKGILQI